MADTDPRAPGSPPKLDELDQLAMRWAATGGPTPGEQMLILKELSDLRQFRDITLAEARRRRERTSSV